MLMHVSPALEMLGPHKVLTPYIYVYDTLCVMHAYMIHVHTRKPAQSYSTCVHP